MPNPTMRATAGEEPVIWRNFTPLFRLGFLKAFNGTLKITKQGKAQGELKKEDVVWKVAFYFSLLTCVVPSQ